MGLALDWYRREICEREAHTHGEPGELHCLLLRLAQVRSLQAGQHAPPGAGFRPDRYRVAGL